MGAVTSDPVPVSGCRVELLGSIRYIPVAAPELRRRFSTSRGVDWAAMPVLKFNTKDNLQQQLLAARNVQQLPPTHTVPSSQGFLAAVTAGLGWGMIPELQLTDELADDALVRLEDTAYQDVALYWQAWTLDSERLNRLTDAVRSAAKDLLRPGDPRKATGPSRAGNRRRK
ncbi:MAG TPA: LysR substrate-binding domain-containing protein, partial [Arthrobacter sp.]